MASLHLTTPFLATSPPPSASKRLLSLGRTMDTARWTCRKKGGVHPEYYEDARVYCNGELVMTTGGTQKEYNVDAWSGTHPFYLGDRSSQMVEDEYFLRFMEQYAFMGEEYMTFPKEISGPLPYTPEKKAPRKKK